MRILFLSESPLAKAGRGQDAARLARRLLDAGHRVQAIELAEHPTGIPALPVDSVTCRRDDLAADLRFQLPGFGPGARLPYRSLHPLQLAALREKVRQRLDRLVEMFNPEIIHTAYLWLGAQLVVETGVPLVATVGGEELDDLEGRLPYRTLVEQAAENASSLIAVNETASSRFKQIFETAGDRIVNPPAAALAAGDEWVVRLYERAATDRLG